MSENIKFHQRLKELRNLKKLTQSDIAEMLDVRKTTISNYETGYSNPDAKTLEFLADFFGVTIDYLVGRETSIPISSEDSPFGKEGYRLKRIPIVGVVRAGEPIFASQNIVEYADMPTEIVGNGDYFGLKIDGNSMNRSRIHDGDIIVVRKQEVIENGQIGVVMIEKENATVKKFYKTDERITLMPDSFDPSFEPISVDISKTDFRIVGRVVAAIIKI